MNLLKALFSILDMWRPAFCKEEAFIRAKELAIACLCGCGRKTITSMAIFLGRGQKLPTADYKFYSECKWDVQDLFNPILATAAQYVTGNYLCIAVDDTKIRKTGKKILQARWHADPLGPKFRTNLIWSLRYLQISLLLPLYEISENTPTRAIPIRFISAPYVKKPGKKATEAEWEHYRLLVKSNNLSTLFVEHILQLRKDMDDMGLQNKKLLVAVDGSFCNKTCMSINDPRIIMPVNEAITLYYEKHHAMRQGDMTKLLELKNKCPEIFDKEKDAQIRDMIDYAKEFQASDRYKELRRAELKEKLFVINNDSTEKQDESWPI